MPTVAAIVPTIPERLEVLQRALDSVRAQTRPVDSLLVEMDGQHLGAAAVRNQLVARSRADYVAFLDDDDEWLPHHVDSLLRRAEDTGADLVYACWESETPAPVMCGPWDPVRIKSANWIPVTFLVRRDAFLAVGGFPQPGTPEWPLPDAEDWGLLVRLAEVGAKVEWVEWATWRWHHEGTGHTRGVPQ